MVPTTLARDRTDRVGGPLTGLRAGQDILEEYTSTPLCRYTDGCRGSKRQDVLRPTPTARLPTVYTAHRRTLMGVGGWDLTAKALRGIRYSWA